MTAQMISEQYAERLAQGHTSEEFKLGYSEHFKSKSM